eukprot:m.437456 g.437456  ORF g.437456 m.437456 type:complete len:313 (+) comp21436_c0_seq20:73-1011(+)
MDLQELMLVTCTVGWIMPTVDATPFVQDRFAISFWVDPIVPAEEFSEQYATIAQANFTVVLGGFGAKDPESVAQQLRACEINGLACIPSACESGPPLTPTDRNKSCVGLNSTSLWGFQMKDEPKVQDFPFLKNWSASIATRRERENILRFINLLPNYASVAQLGGVGYETYVQKFIDTVEPNFLCMDHYPLFDAGSANSTRNITMAGTERDEHQSASAIASVHTSLHPSFCQKLRVCMPWELRRRVHTWVRVPTGYHRNLRVFRELSLSAGLPFWYRACQLPFVLSSTPGGKQRCHQPSYFMCGTMCVRVRA